MAVLVAVVHVGVLNVATAPVLGIDTGVISAFDRDATVAVETVMDIHAATGVVNIGAASVRAGADHASVGGAGLMASYWGAACWTTRSVVEVVVVRPAPAVVVRDEVVVVVVLPAVFVVV
jgi:hypothetical protein